MIPPNGSNSLPPLLLPPFSEPPLPEMPLERFEEELPRLLEDVDLLVNTVPAQGISREDLARLRKGTLLLELASEPGFDREAAAELGLRPLYAPGLPGQFAPEAAAELYWETVCAIGREKEENDGG